MKDLYFTFMPMHILTHVHTNTHIQMHTHSSHIQEPSYPQLDNCSLNIHESDTLWPQGNNENLISLTVILKVSFAIPPCLLIQIFIILGHAVKSLHTEAKSSYYNNIY